MDHGDAVTLPVSAGAPEPGQRRFSVALTVFNEGRIPQAFSSLELALTAGPVSPGTRPPVSHRLLPGQFLPMSLDFDVPATSAVLRLEWARGSERAVLLATRPPASANSMKEEAAPRWPGRIEALPQGDSAAGAALFHGRFACVTCHGDPRVPGSNRIGPSLHDFVRVGATRVVGQSAAQYAYESLLEPNAFIPPECAGPADCARPSTMPMYGDALSPQQMADLIRYLMEPRPQE
ncbi:c-type cytochrome [Pyxidicoccus sp. 3LFB2]